MVRLLGTLALGAAVCAAGLLSAAPQEPKKADRPEIKGGIEGQVKKVDPEKGTLTVTVNGRERTFTVTEDTTIVGPRGGVVRRKLKDPRFHEGLDVTVVASGATATQLHLGYDRGEADEPGTKPKSTDKASADKKGAPAEPKKAGDRPPDKKVAKGGDAKKPEEDNDEEEYPGKVKSVDASKRLLVITLLNGQDRSFLLAAGVPVLVGGAASKQGLGDAALKPGTPITVVTEPGGRKVKEVRVAPPRARKAG